MLKLSDLALRPDRQLGSMLVSPSRRLVEGPGGHAHIEPLIMQVFLLLLDAGGKVVTRNELFDQCWGGVIVGDDSLNRAIAKVRRTGGHVAPGLFEIETIPRTGYRLTGEILHLGEQLEPSAATAQSGSRISRRTLVGTGVVTAAALGAGGFGLWWTDSQKDREFDDLMARGEHLLAQSDPAARSRQYFERAVAIRPGNAKAQGLFAYTQAQRADNAESGQSIALQEAERAARKALELDQNEPHARLAQLVIQKSMLDFAATEDGLRKVLATAPDNLSAMRQTWAFLVSVGRIRDALAIVERALSLKPFAAGNHYPWAQLLWILGRTAQADRVIDRAMQYWPSHQYVRFARFSIFAYTGRPRAALAMLAKKETTPQNFSPEAISLWRVSLPALDQRSPSAVAAALKANLEAAKQNLQLSSQAASTLSALGEVDAAFEIAYAHYAVRGPTYSVRQGSRPPVRSTAWRFAPWLFTPPTAPMRADPRFNAICDEIGLTEYWAKRGIKPDYQLGTS